MRDPRFHITKKKDKDSESYEGAFIYRSLRYKFTLHRQGEKRSDGSKQKAQYRGRITVCSPKDGHPMEFKAAHHYGEKKEVKVKYREFSTTSVKRDAVTDCMR